MEYNGDRNIENYAMFLHHAVVKDMLVKTGKGTPTNFPFSGTLWVLKLYIVFGITSTEEQI